MMSDDFSKLYQSIEVPSSVNDIEELDFTTKNIIRKIEAQRTTLEGYFDDGARQLRDLQNLLTKNGYDKLLLDESIFNALQSDDEVAIKRNFGDYVTYVEDIKNKFIPRQCDEFTENSANISEIIITISKKLSRAANEKPKDFYEIIETLMYRLNDLDVVGDIVKNYTSIIGSTCAQAGKSGDIINLQDDKYDYVIIDEAARANPLDIMIPMMMGTKVVLIGDHKQLPHYIETNYVNLFKLSVLYLLS